MGDWDDEDDHDVTDRFPDDRVTQRLPEEGLTDRFDDPDARPQGVAPGAVLAQGELVEGRYRVEEGPLGIATGEADVFRCVDTATGEDVALKLYHERISPKEGILASLSRMSHPDIVEVKGYGVWAGRFYETMEYCAGGSLADHMPFAEGELRGILRETVSGLHYLHTQGIVHRDIKPNNLFYRRPGKQDLVIGDFGVSSLLTDDEKVRKTSTATFFTLDYAAPELIDGKEVSPKTDYYALGITLLHLFKGRSPLAGMDKNAILGCHFRGAVPRPEGLSAEFARLANGLLRVAPESRWGYAQIVSWLDGEPILTDDGLPDRDDAFIGKRIPYRSLPDIATPAEMAERLDDFDAEKDLQRGYISQWLMFFDTSLGLKVSQIEEESSDDPASGVLRLKYLLDPRQPLDVGGLKLHSVAELAKLLAGAPEVYIPRLTKLLYSQAIETWVESVEDSDEARELARKIAQIRTRTESPSVGLAALLFTLDPRQPFRITEQVSLQRIEDLDSVVGTDPDLIDRTTHHLFAGRFEEWLRAAFPNRKDDIRFLHECVERFKHDRREGFLAFRYHFCPRSSFRFGAMLAETPKDLATLIVRDPVSWERGVQALSSGAIRTWLVETGQLADPAAFDAIVQEPTASWSRKLEAVLHVLNPALPWPEPIAEPADVDGGALPVGSSRTVRVAILNATRGFLSGTVTLTEPHDGFIMARRTLEGEGVTLNVTMSAVGLSARDAPRAVIEVDTNGGKLEIPLHFTVSAPLRWILLKSALAGVIAGELLGLFRSTLQDLVPACREATLGWMARDFAAAHPELWGYIPGGIVFLALVAAAAGAAIVRIRAEQ